MLIGVDLGLTNARAAFIGDDGRCELLETLTGRRLVPAAVGIDSNGQLHVGESARNQHILDPDQATMRLRRLLGTGQRVMLADKSFSPQELVAVVLSQMKEFCEQRLAKPVSGLALAVPCDFTASQSQAAIAAARLAGFRTVHLVLEPVAVAAAYGFSPRALAADQPLLIVDVGARSCEAAVLVHDDRTNGWKVLASAGNSGGSEECDQRIVAHLAHLYEREFGLSPHGSRKAMARLRLAAEWAKRTLSEKDATTVRLPSLLTVGHTPFDLTAELSREQLELLVEDEVRKSLQAVEIVLREARLLPSQLYAVLLSGGGAEMPLLPRLLEEMVLSRPRQEVRPEEAIARGAAILGTARISESAAPALPPQGPPAEPKPEPAPTAEGETKPEPEPEPKIEAKPETAAATEPAQQPEPEKDPAS